MTVTSNPAVIRLLTPDDARAYRALRLRALAEHPEAFTSSAEEESTHAAQWSVQRLTPDSSKPHDFFIGAFDGGRLVGMLGLEGRYRYKERHHATVLGMYVVPDSCGHGIGLALMHDLLARARAMPALEQLELTVTDGNRRAQSLYERLGFTVYGVLPRAIRVQGSDYAKILMSLRLR